MHNGDAPSLSVGVVPPPSVARRVPFTLRAAGRYSAALWGIVRRRSRLLRAPRPLRASSSAPLSLLAALAPPLRYDPPAALRSKRSRPPNGRRGLFCARYARVPCGGCARRSVAAVLWRLRSPPAPAGSRAPFVRAAYRPRSLSRFPAAARVRLRRNFSLWVAFLRASRRGSVCRRPVESAARWRARRSSRCALAPLRWLRVGALALLPSRAPLRGRAGAGYARVFVRLRRWGARASGLPRPRRAKSAQSRARSPYGSLAGSLRSALTPPAPQAQRARVGFWFSLACPALGLRRVARRDVTQRAPRRGSGEEHPPSRPLVAQSAAATCAVGVVPPPSSPRRLRLPPEGALRALSLGPPSCSLRSHTCALATLARRVKLSKRKINFPNGKC